MLNECEQYARDTYVKVNALVGDTVEAMAELTSLGAPLPAKFAESKAWFDAQDAIEQAVASGDMPTVRFTCNDYLHRARANCEAVIGKMLDYLRQRGTWNEYKDRLGARTEAEANIVEEDNQGVVAYSPTIQASHPGADE